ncbi:MAG: SPOR domain-containing protein [Alloprevotella sp.]|nr:SPOR domain-containing protein [Alloprevotella sp.]
MKKIFLFSSVAVLALCMSSCKAKEDAWQQAYNKATENAVEDQAVVQVPTVQEDVAKVTPVTVQNNNATDVSRIDSDVRTINGKLDVVSGKPLKAFSVVVGSFVNQTNAESLKERLAENGYDARVVKTNETINGHTEWYRVIASSFDDKASAIASKETLKQTYATAWLLYVK